MAPVKSVSNSITVTYTVTYYTVTCTPSSSTFACTTSSMPFRSTAQGHATMALYLQATRTTITDGAIGFGPLQMEWRSTPLATFTSWSTAASDAFPSGFDARGERILATKLLTTDVVLSWIASMPSDVQAYYASVSLPMYTTPVQLYRYYELVSTMPKPSGTSVLVGDGAAFASELTSTRPASASAETSSIGIPDPLSMSTSSSGAMSSPTEMNSTDIVVTPGQTAAISVSVAVFALAMICGLVVYYKRIRPARNRYLSEVSQAQGKQYTGQGTQDPNSLALAVQIEKPDTTTSSPVELLALMQSPLPELDSISPVATSRTSASRHYSAELEGSPSVNSNASGFVIDAGLYLPSRALDSNR